MPESLENLTGLKLLEVTTWDPEGQTIELQYRIDQKGPWMLAERTDISRPLKIIAISGIYSIPAKEVEGASWLIEIDAESIDDGEHILEFRVLRKEIDSQSYTNEYAQIFSVKNSGDTANTDSTQNQQTELVPILLSCTIIASMFAVAYISRKTTLHH